MAISNDLITMIAAFLFTPCLAQDLAVAFGLLMGDDKLARQRLSALGTRTYARKNVAWSAGMTAAALLVLAAFIFGRRFRQRVVPRLAPQ